jgi:biofilm PGA synthesis N-glycosyltransferase PgaC
MTMNASYVLITPARNEGKDLEKTVRSVVQQTVRPREWVIVNDGSTDQTGEVADEAARQYPWIRVVHRTDRGFRQAGGGVVDTFYDGYERLTVQDWEFLGKIDGDLSFDADYFERCFEHFRADSSLAVGGGTIHVESKGVLVKESDDPRFHVRGATKIYRRAFWDAMGGLIRAPGWDTLDEVKANMLGWTSYTFPDLTILHHRPTGEADGTWRNWCKNGLANYITGYHPLFMLTKCVKRVLQPPVGLMAIGLLCGFFGGYLRGVPQVPDEELIRYLRRQQLNRLLFRESLWS